MTDLLGALARLEAKEWSDAAREAALLSRRAHMLSRISITGRPEGTGTEKDPVAVGTDLSRAVELLAHGKHIRMDGIRQVGTLVDRLHDIAVEAHRRGEQAPMFNLCLVSIPGTNLFCAEHRGLARVEMPQLRGEAIPGSPAAAMVDVKGKADLAPLFLQELRHRGITVEPRTVPASQMKASQKELNGAQIGSLMDFLRSGRSTPGQIFITRDGYILDGHHRWAAEIGLDRQVSLPVQELGMDIGAALDFARTFSQKMGIKQKGLYPMTTVKAMLESLDRLEAKAWSPQARAAALAARRAKAAARAHGNGDLADHPLPAGKYPHGDPRNDPDYERRYKDVERRVRRALDERKDTESRHGSKRNGELRKNAEGDRIYKPSRVAEHKRIIDKIMDDHAHVPNDHKAVMLGGLPGSGKSRYLANHGHGLGGFLKVDGKGNPTNAVVINPDLMKDHLMTGRDSKGRPLMQRVKGLSQGEHASLVHEESSHLAKMLANRVLHEGKNAVFDVTLGDAKKAKEKYLTNEKKTGAIDKGYQVHHAFVEGDLSTSLHRAGLRHKAIDEKGKRTFEGRWTPLENIHHEGNTNQALNSDGKVAASKNRLASDQLTKEGLFHSAVRFDNKTGKQTTVHGKGSKSLDLADLAGALRVGYNGTVREVK